MQLLSDKENRLAKLAAQLLAVCVRSSEEASSAEAIEGARKLHDDKKLYPRLTVTSPHGGGAVCLSLSLCDPVSDEAVVSLVRIEAEQEVAH